jgi:cytochrome P450
MSTVQVKDGSDLEIDEFMLMGPMAPVRNPYILLEKLRQGPPLKAGPNDAYLVTRYDQVRDVLRDDEVYSSAIVQRTMGIVMGPTIVGMDGREHLRHRALVTPALAPRALRGDFPKLVESVAHRHIDRFVGAGEVDLTSQFTFLYPLSVFVGILGLPEEDVEDFHNWGVDLTLVVHDPGKGIAASQKMYNYLAPVVARKRENPSDDLISVLATAEVDGAELSDEEVISFLRLLVLAGAETTYHLMGSAIYAMLQDAELSERVFADRSCIPALLTETLRWESPIGTVMRETAEDTELGGVSIPKDTPVLVHIGSANRDERMFENPNVFDIDRDATEHVAFGLGKHYCAGSRLALLEAEVGLNALFDRLDNIRPQPGEDFGIIGFSFRGPDRLPVLFDAR